MISLLMPSRKRPANVLRVMESALETALQPDALEFVFYVDTDDGTFPYGLTPAPATVLTGPRIVLSEMWNRCYEAATGPYYWHGGDDNIFRTPGWDADILSAFDSYNDKIAFVHGRDGSPHDSTGFGTHGFTHRNWVESIGYFVPPYFSSDYNDTWLNDVANRIGRHIVVPTVMIEHMHFSHGKGELDITHQERLVRHQQDNVEALYASLASEREADASKLQSFINNYEDTSCKLDSLD